MKKFHKFAATSQGTKYLAKCWNCQDYSAALSFDKNFVAVSQDIEYFSRKILKFEEVQR